MKYSLEVTNSKYQAVYIKNKTVVRFDNNTIHLINAYRLQQW